MHPQSQAVLSSSGVKRRGEIPGAAFLWAPSQKGCKANGEEVKAGIWGCRGCLAGPGAALLPPRWV